MRNEIFKAQKKESTEKTEKMAREEDPNQASMGSQQSKKKFQGEGGQPS